MDAAAAATTRVTTLELFFDLVFVFTITQLTAVLYHGESLRALLQVVLMLGVIWWMYGGYAWLTSSVPAHTTNRRLLLLGGMAGYFVLALAIPHAFSSSGLALIACLWWLYFAGDTERAEESLGSMGLVRRAQAALNGFGYWHLPMLLGIIAIAAAERRALGRPFAELSWWRAGVLAGGVAAFLAGGVLFRRELQLGRVAVRAATAVLAVATVPLGAATSAAVQIAALVALRVACIAVAAGSA